MEPTLEPVRSNAQVREAAPSEVDRAVSSAADRAEEFARLSPHKKADLLERLTASLTAVSADIVATRRGSCW